MTDNSISGEGAFYPRANGDNGTVYSNTKTWPRYYIMFDASRCSAVYGKSETVNPTSLATNWFIKH